MAVKIIMEGVAVFSYFMDDTGLKNDWWMNCKYNTVQKTGVSSMRALLDRVVDGKSLEAWCRMPMSYFLCGGGFPIYLHNGEMKACVLVSALTHEEDHQLIVDALSEMLGVETPSLPAE